jgi:hypothetical protein
MSNIHLILSSRKPWDATYRTPEGQAIYKVEAAMPTLGARDIKISRVVPSFVDNQVTTKDEEAEFLRDSFAHLATVEYHTLRGSRIRMGELDVATNEYFKKDGWSFFGRWALRGRSHICRLNLNT